MKIFDMINYDKTIHTFSEECSICLDKFVQSEKVILLECKHSYHPKCLYGWIREKMVCPTCKKLISMKQNYDMDQNNIELEEIAIE